MIVERAHSLTTFPLVMLAAWMLNG